MKFTGIRLVLCLIAITAFRFVADTLEQVGSTLDEVKKQTVYQLAEDHFSTYYSNDIKNACKKLPVGVREATMLSVGKIIRDYVESPQFKIDYEKYLQDRYSGSTFDGKDPKWQERKKEKLDDFTKMINSDNKQLVDMFVSTLDAEIQSKQSMVDMASNPAMQSVMAALIAQIPNYKTDIQDNKMLKELYTKDLAAFKKKYPEIMASRTVRDEMAQEKQSAESQTREATENIDQRKDYRARLKSQLEEFLAQSANINFAAATRTDGDGRQIFVLSEYEQKDGQWKFYYRCGKEAVGGARKYAQGWLASLH